MRKEIVASVPNNILYIIIISYYCSHCILGMNTAI